MLARIRNAHSCSRGIGPPYPAPPSRGPLPPLASSWGTKSSGAARGASERVIMLATDRPNSFVPHAAQWGKEALSPTEWGKGSPRGTSGVGGLRVHEMNSARVLERVFMLARIRNAHSCSRGIGPPTPQASGRLDRRTLPPLASSWGRSCSRRSWRSVGGHDCCTLNASWSITHRRSPRLKRSWCSGIGVAPVSSARRASHDWRSLNPAYTRLPLRTTAGRPSR
jgi:hypothetical protein